MIRILIVEDDPAQRYLVDVMLRREGYQTVGVGSGDEALRLLALDSDFAAVLSDVRMPGMDSADFLYALSAAYSRLPVIIMSVHAGSGWVEDVAANGAAATLAKPFSGQELIEMIEGVLRSRIQAP